MMVVPLFVPHHNKRDILRAYALTFLEKASNLSARLDRFQMY